ncbi:hypothetical protein PIB30_053380 [Stylosanthes scabra]|uniref:Uncharacterized protein n=1 Tax=Stylosanthes scabra TaxID=79078 RepID=A0ABU6SIA1_9FABA|nr:hypothetical protein [Stylosanthes scabra]
MPRRAPSLTHTQTTTHTHFYPRLGVPATPRRALNPHPPPKPVTHFPTTPRLGVPFHSPNPRLSELALSAVGLSTHRPCFRRDTPSNPMRIPRNHSRRITTQHIYSILSTNPYLNPPTPPQTHSPQYLSILTPSHKINFELPLTSNPITPNHPYHTYHSQHISHSNPLTHHHPCPCYA